MLVKDETSYTSKIEEAKTFNNFEAVMNYCFKNKLDKNQFTFLTLEKEETELQKTN